MKNKHPRGQRQTALHSTGVDPAAVFLALPQSVPPHKTSPPFRPHLLDPGAKSGYSVLASLGPALGALQAHLIIMGRMGTSFFKKYWDFDSRATRTLGRGGEEEMSRGFWKRVSQVCCIKGDAGWRRWQALRLAPAP